MRNWHAMPDRLPSIFESPREFLKSAEVVPGVSDIRPSLPESV